MVLGAGRGRGRAAGQRVMVGERQQLHLALRGQGDQFGRAEAPVGMAAVRVQVDAFVGRRVGVHGRHHSRPISNGSAR